MSHKLTVDNVMQYQMTHTVTRHYHWQQYLKPWIRYCPRAGHVILPCRWWFFPANNIPWNLPGNYFVFVVFLWSKKWQRWLSGWFWSWSVINDCFDYRGRRLMIKNIIKTLISNILLPKKIEKKWEKRRKGREKMTEWWKEGIKDGRKEGKIEGRMEGSKEGWKEGSKGGKKGSMKERKGRKEKYTNLQTLTIMKHVLVCST